MNNNDKEFIIQKIRTQYTEKANTDLDILKALDKRVKRPANIFAGVFGGLGALVMGGGMSLVMTDLGYTLGVGSSFEIGVGIGIIGMLMATINYPIYKKILTSRKNKYANRVVELSDRIMKG